MKRNEPSYLSETLKAKLNALGLTQLDVSKKTGINRSILSKFENMEQTPSLEQLEFLCDALEIDPAFLFIDPDTQNIDDIKKQITSNNTNEKQKPSNSPKMATK